MHLLRGSIVHRTVERFHSEGFADSAQFSYYDDIRHAVIELLKDEWASKRDALLSLDLKEQDLVFYYADSQKMIINFLHDFLKTWEAPVDLSDLELKIFSRKYRTMCIVDKVLRNRDPPLIVDYKTCKSAELKDEYKRQMGICALLYEEKYGIKPKAAIHYLKFLNCLKEVPLTEEYIEGLKRLIIKVHDKTKSENEEDYPCTCGGWCEKDIQMPT